MFVATSTPIKHSQAEDCNGNGNNNASFASTAEHCANFPYPACWQDKERMNVLLASFRPRDVNPENYDSKMKFWKDIVAQYCEHKRSSCFCKRELLQAFTCGQKIPYCLDAVLKEMLRTKMIRRRIEYEYDPENTWSGWAMNLFVKKPLAWGVHKLKSTVGCQTSDDLCEYVHLAVMKMLCEELETQVLQQHQGELLHYDAFRELVAASMSLQEDCLRLCVHTLHCQGKIVLEYKLENKEQRIHLIKIPSKTNAKFAITEIDHAVHKLRMIQKGLTTQLESMEQDIKTNEQNARKLVQANKRTLAKTYLRRKNLLEQSCAKRSATLHNIDALLVSVEEAQSNGEILEAYKIGAKALQALSESGLRYDNVEEVLAEVRDTMDAHREVQDTLANESFAADTTLYDNDELERELQAIVGENSKTPKKAAAEDNTKTTAAATANNVNVTVEAPLPVPAQISDAELLAMLEGLDVEDKSPAKEEKISVKQPLNE